MRERYGACSSIATVTVKVRAYIFLAALVSIAGCRGIGADEDAANNGPAGGFIPGEDDVYPGQGPNDGHTNHAPVDCPQTPSTCEHDLDVPAECGVLCGNDIGRDRVQVPVCGELAEVSTWYMVDDEVHAVHITRELDMTIMADGAEYVEENDSWWSHPDNESAKVNYIILCQPECEQP